MHTPDNPDLIRQYEEAADRADSDTYTLRLFVAGAGPRSLSATERVRAFCERHLRGRHSLDVIDLYEHPDTAQTANILGAPTLVKDSPGPPRRLVGDMRNEERLLRLLGLTPAVGSSS
ncbi:MAG: hypothetical protein HKP27_13685 [Myxococcales bacterium]|nr:hypothetical protein [Myxococcales bacterium]